MAAQFLIELQLASNPEMLSGETRPQSGVIVETS